MNTIFKATICRFLAIALMMIPFQTGQASMIGTDQVHAASTVQVDRNTVVSYLNRAETAGQFQALGLDTQTALDRVAMMSDDEVKTLAGKVNAVPAGGDGLIAIILVVFFIWYFAFRR